MTTTSTADELGLTASMQPAQHAFTPSTVELGTRTIPEREAAALCPFEEPGEPMVTSDHGPMRSAKFHAAWYGWLATRKYIRENRHAAAGSCHFGDSCSHQGQE